MVKRLLIVTVFLCLPWSSMAMKPMSDQTLAGVSGQSGVSIFVDVTMNIHIDTLAWGDSDGLAPGPYNPWSLQTTGGYVGVTNLVVSGLHASHFLMSASANSVSLMPYEGSIDVVNGVPYYHVQAGPGRE